MEDYIRDLKETEAEAKDENKDVLLALLNELEEIEKELHMDAYDARVAQQLKVYPSVFTKETEYQKAKRIVDLLETMQERAEHFKGAVDYVLEKAYHQSIMENFKELEAKERKCK